MIILWLSFFNKYLATHGDLQGDPFRLGLSGFSKFGSFLLQEVVDWLALHQEWLEEKQISFGRATFQSLCCAGQDWLLFRWQWNCCQGQGYCCPSNLLHRRLQTADLVQCRECKVFKWKMWFFAAAVSWLQVRETVRLGWLAERRWQEVLERWLVHRLPPLLLPVSWPEPFIAIGPKLVSLPFDPDGGLR